MPPDVPDGFTDTIRRKIFGLTGAKLYRVELVAPPRVVGRNTIHAIQAGVRAAVAAPTRAMVGP